MNDEIKEIQHELNILSNTILDNTTYCPTIKRRKLLLDYITNLQQIEQEHKKLNGELREQIKILEENNQNMQEEMARVWEENKRLKEDKRKAIEYICRKDMEANLKGNAEFKSKDLINILQNGGKENE